MVQSRRFGKRLAVPSTVQIMHELRVLMAQDAVHEQALRTGAALDISVQPRPFTPDKLPS